MAHSQAAIDTLKYIAEEQYKLAIGTLSTLLCAAPTKFIDEIITMAVTKEQKEFYDAICTIIYVPYPNEKGFVSIYVNGISFCKFSIKN